MELVARNPNTFDSRIIETVILELGDLFQIRIEWNSSTALLTGAFAVVGGIAGGYGGGRLGAVIGSSIGTVAGLGASTMLSLREIWASVKEKLQELMFIVFNFLRRLDPLDYVAAVEILLASSTSRKELVLTMLEVIAAKLGRQVLSSITA